MPPAAYGRDAVEQGVRDAEGRPGVAAAVGLERSRDSTQAMESRAGSSTLSSRVEAGRLRRGQAAVIFRDGAAETLDPVAANGQARGQLCPP